MLPIIRRHREPLLPSDAKPAPPPPAMPAAVEVATPQPPPALTHPAAGIGPPEPEKRSDFGQFWSDLPGAIPQPSALNPQALWSRQPGEPAADYSLFATWLQLPAPRPLTKTASALACSPHRLRRLAARHHWRTRAAAFDNQRADAASAALDKLLRDEATDWQERARRFRLDEWRLHETMLAAANQAAHEFEQHPRRASLTEIARLLDLTSVLGRRACSLPLDPASAASPLASLAPDFEAALRRAYGDRAGTTPGPRPAQGRRYLMTQAGVSDQRT